MSPDAIRDALFACLGQIAPEAEASEIDPGRSLREQLDLDSMDFLRFAVAVHGRLGVEIPEADYPRLATLESAIAYLGEKVGR
ncbi:MAG TPA: acyl carrier protein [Thermoanaerobaculia bacterium]|nr:acyl carrier protein [Thermoanaerobaculia bacterium]